MSGVSEFATIRRLPDGNAQPARIAKEVLGRLEVAVTGGEAEAFAGGMLVEIDGERAIYLGEVVDRQPDSLVTVAVEHFIDRTTLAEVERAWKTAEA